MHTRWINTGILFTCRRVKKQDKQSRLLSTDFLHLISARYSSWPESENKNQVNSVLLHQYQTADHNFPLTSQFT